jgi:hypothetical protein
MASAQPVYRTAIERIQSWHYEKGEYEMLLGSFPTVIKVPADSRVAPCLENAYKAEMEVLITFDPSIPKVITCKVYSQGFPYAPSMIEKQAQEEGRPEQIKKR